PKFQRYGIEQGLSGNEIQAITEDQWGRIYVGTGHGVDRLNPSNGRVRWYTTADGLAPGEIQTAIHDRNGGLWFGTVQGVSVMTPQKDDQWNSPPLRVMALRIAGKPYAMPGNGVTELTIPDLRADQSQLSVDFLGISFAPGETLRYEYSLEGL